jgi:sec-independent protein translocase protein TatA
MLGRLSQDYGWRSVSITVTLVIVVLIFGANRLPQLGKGVGSAIKNFKDGMKEGTASDDHKS